MSKARSALTSSLFGAVAPTVPAPAPAVPVPSPTRPPPLTPPRVALPASPAGGSSGAPVRNRTKSQAAAKQAERGVRILTMILFPAQVAKLKVLRDFLFQNDLGNNVSLAVRASFHMSTLGEDLLSVGRSAVEGSDHVPQNASIYKEEQDILKETLGYFLRHSVGSNEAVVGRAVLMAAAPNNRFLDIARDLKERQDQRGKKVKQ